MTDLLESNLRAVAVLIADQIVPEYRHHPTKIYSCTGTVAKRWQAAYDAAVFGLSWEESGLD